MKQEIVVRPLLSEERGVSLFLAFNGILGLAVAYISGSGLVLLLGLVSNIAGVALYFAMGPVLNTIFHALNVHPTYRDLEIIDDVVLTQGARGYQAAAYTSLSLRTTLGEVLSPSERGDYLKSLENFLANVRMPVKISLLTYPVDLERVRRKAKRKYDEERAKEAEARAKKEYYREGTVKEAKEELAKQLARLESENMFEALCYACVYAEDNDKHVAVEKAKRMRENMKQGLATAYGANTSYVGLADLPGILRDEAFPIEAAHVQMRMQALFSQDLASRAWITMDLEPKASELMPDSEGRCGIAIRLGETYLYRKPFYWIPGLLVNYGVAILGTSGAGKSTTVFTIESVGAMEAGINALIIDWNAEYVDYTLDKGGSVVNLGPESLNLMQLAGEDPATRIQQILNSLDIAFDLKGAGRQRRKLREYMEKAYRQRGINQEEKSTWAKDPAEYPTLKEVLWGVEEAIEEIKEDPHGQTGLQESLISLSEKIVFWTTPPNDFFCRPSTVDLDKLLLSGLVCINLKPLLDDKSKAMAALTILDYAATKMTRMEQAKPGVLRQLMILDEPWKVADETADTSINPLLRIAKEGRKFGFGLVVSTQNIKDISPRALSNLSGMVIILRMEDEGDIERVCSNFGIPDHLREGIHYFDVWHGIIKLNYKRGAKVFRGIIKPELRQESLRIRIPEPETEIFPAIEAYIKSIMREAKPWMAGS